ncbi:MAG: lamin tail domain-containing protein, partial [Candidatus Saccharimonadales bacterium]
MISEVQTRPGASATDYPDERFVELYNPNAYQVNVSGWKLEYKPGSGGSWSNRLASAQPATVVYDIDAKGFYIIGTGDFAASHPAVHTDLLLNNSALTSNDGGHVRLTAADGTVIDQLGWGNADSALVKPAPAPDYGQSLQRCFVEDSLTDSGNNFNDFAVYDAVTPGSAAKCSQRDPDPVSSGGTAPSSVNMCPGLAISEIGANLDAGQQFIEVYNSNGSALDTSGCQLQTNRSSTRTYDFNRILAAHAYFAVYVKDTDLILTKTTTGTVYILSSDGLVETAAVSYGGLKAGTSWARFGGNDWQQTYMPTPGRQNVPQRYPPCPAGQYRNSQTDRCDKISA